MSTQEKHVRWANSVQGTGNETVAVFIADRLPKMARCLERIQWEIWVYPRILG